MSAGAIGPTNKSLSVSPSVENPAYRGITYDEIEEIYHAQIDALYDGGVDIFLVETIFDTLDAKAAIYALERFFGAKQLHVLVMMSGTIVDNSGKLIHTYRIFLTSSKFKISSYDAERIQQALRVTILNDLIVIHPWTLLIRRFSISANLYIYSRAARSVKEVGVMKYIEVVCTSMLYSSHDYNLLCA